MNKLLLSALFTCTLHVHLFAQDYFSAKNHWETREAAALGMDPAKLQNAVNFAIAHESEDDRNLKIAHYEGNFGREPFGYPIGPMKNRGAATGLIIYKGYVVAQWGDPNRVDLTFSIAKSFLSTTVGLAVSEGLIADEKDVVYPYMAPIYPHDPGRLSAKKADHFDQEDTFELFDTEHNRTITWEHLLRQTSDWQGFLWGKPDWADRPNASAKEKRHRAQRIAGSTYEYNDTRVNVLALAIMNVWRKPLPVVLKDKIINPIAASNTWRWTGYENSFVIIDGQIMQSVSGGSHWGGGMMISAWDQARFGYLTLRNGRWKEQQLIPESWIAKSRTSTESNPNYGFMNYFLNYDQTDIPAAPKTAFSHIGAGTNMIYVDQENDLLIVARWIPREQKNELVKMVLESIQ